MAPAGAGGTDAAMPGRRPQSLEIEMKRKIRRIPVAPLAAAVLLFALCLTLPLSASAEDAGFDAYWHDGLAELDGYDLTVSRYGEERQGTAVMIYVTEPFSEKKLVKVDDANANRRDTFDALKLNLVRDFQTGIYDYNTMSSLFVRSDDFRPSKISFSSAEWCGHVYDERIFRRGKVERSLRSYFEDRSEERRISNPSEGIVEENLFILLRGLRGAFLKEGERKSFVFLPSSYAERIGGAPFEWTTAVVKREKGLRETEVPAGRFDTILYKVEISGGRTGEFFVDSKYPHVIVRWTLPPDSSGELTGSTRLPYWKLNGNGDEKYLGEIGLGG